MYYARPLRIALHMDGTVSRFVEVRSPSQAMHIQASESGFVAVIRYD